MNKAYIKRHAFYNQVYRIHRNLRYEMIGMLSIINCVADIFDGIGTVQLHHEIQFLLTPLHVIMFSVVNSLNEAPHRVNENIRDSNNACVTINLFVFLNGLFVTGYVCDICNRSFTVFFIYILLITILLLLLLLFFH